MLFKRYSVLSALGLATVPGQAESRKPRAQLRLRPCIDVLERRLVLSRYLWTAMGDGMTWDDPQNWQHVDRMTGMKMTGVPTAFSDVVFPPLSTLPPGRSASINNNDPFL